MARKRYEIGAVRGGGGGGGSFGEVRPARTAGPGVSLPFDRELGTVATVPLDPGQLSHHALSQSGGRSTQGSNTDILV